VNACMHSFCDQYCQIKEKENVCKNYLKSSNLFDQFRPPYHYSIVERDIVIMIRFVLRVVLKLCMYTVSKKTVKIIFVIG